MKYIYIHYRSTLAVLIIMGILPLLLFTAGCSSSQDGGRDESFMQKYEAAPEKLNTFPLNSFFPGSSRTAGLTYEPNSRNVPPIW